VYKWMCFVVFVLHRVNVMCSCVAEINWGF